ncbi:cyclodeaminase/cyclohydrolase family protein [Bacilliculturomica massiliensis]|uniref:cyclodeaminase/cyclohydrolase family protein n=1 Tax=Bacilliculturomica massiliensis TaxID=1917867 RepID=UPI001FEB29AB|nr:cyclodeaminase/cyclohydrolase family protein [Bacilliculturomica massiliensis]
MSGERKRKPMLERSCRDFIRDLSGSAPTPGGGGASALGGALGTALGSMVGNLTLGKKKYAAVQEDIRRLLEELAVLTEEMGRLTERDAEVFEPLSVAYGLPGKTEAEKAEKERILEEALKLACSVPLEIMEKAVEALSPMEELAQKGTRIALSDVGVGAQFLRTAALGALVNVYTNTRLMKDRAYAGEINGRAQTLEKLAVEKADRIFEEVEAVLK